MQENVVLLTSDQLEIVRKIYLKYGYFVSMDNAVRLDLDRRLATASRVRDVRWLPVRSEQAEAFERF